MKRILYLLALFMMISVMMAANAGDPAKYPVLSRFTAEDIHQNVINETILAARELTMINIWATYCNPCLSEMPDLGRLHHDLSDLSFQVIGILTDIQEGAALSVNEKRRQLALDIIEATGAEYTHIIPSSEMYTLFLSQVSAVPCTFFVDKNGNMTDRVYYGARSYEAWKDIIVSVYENINSRE